MGGSARPAILLAWSPGYEAGHALADVLFGDVNPSGKLPVSLPRSVGQEPLNYAELPNGRPATGDLSHLPWDGGEKYESRYLDEENSPLYPFGWGLSYTQFRYSDMTISRSEIPLRQFQATGSKPVVTVSVTVKNIGNRTGAEVAQLYLRNTVASVAQPIRQLKGFTRVTLAPGEETRIEFPLGYDDLSFYNRESKRIIEPTTYKVWVGGNSLAAVGSSLSDRVNARSPTL